MPTNITHIEESAQSLFCEIAVLLNKSITNVVAVANYELVLLNWNIGKSIKTEIIKNPRSGYGVQVVAILAKQLQENFGRGFTRSAIFRMIQFYELFPDFEIVATVSRQLGWSHFLELIPIENSVKREFYMEICRVERWSVRVLRSKIQSMLFERTVVSKKPELTIRNDLAELRTTGKMSKDLVLRDPYLLEFLGLEDTYAEKDLESAILRKLEKFLIELGVVPF